MYIVKIGEDAIKVIDRQDAKTLTLKLIDMDCRERVTTKLIVTEEDEEGFINEKDTKG